MIRWIGVVLGMLTVLWMVLQRSTLSWGSLSAGIALASALFVMLSISKPEKKPVQTPADEKLQWQIKLDEAEARASQTIDGLNREVQKLQQKA
ncbi:MAG: hypothetical protein ABSA17_03570, partial [Rhabdochlamydiaceae bacterium]